MQQSIHADKPYLIDSPLSYTPIDLLCQYSFDDDINLHVQNAIDSILNLQNTVAEPLSYLNEVGSFLNDNPLTPLIHQPSNSNNDFPYVSPSNQASQNQHSPFMS